MNGEVETLMILSDSRNPTLGQLLEVYNKGTQRDPPTLTFYTEKGPREIVAGGRITNPEAPGISSVSITGWLPQGKEYLVEINFLHRERRGGGTFRYIVQ